MRKSLFTLLAVTLLFGFTSLCYSENVVSLKHNPDAVFPQIKVDIHLSGGQGVAGYNGFIVFDAAVLKYVSATMGDYLPSGGPFLRPQLGEDGTYTLALDVDGTTYTGTTVTFPPPPIPDGDKLSLSEFFFEIPSEALQDPSSGIPKVPAAFLRPGVKLWGISIVGSAPLGAHGVPVATDGDGTLVTLTFEVIDPQKPVFILLPGAGLSDSNDVPLEPTLGKTVITASSQEDTTLSTDVNADGEVNILDLTRVASVFGQPVTEANRFADVNGDGEINILDLVQVANDFGKSTESTDSFANPDMGAPMPPETENGQQQIVVGIALPVTGHLAAIGAIMKSGFDLAFDQLAGLSYIIADDKSTADGAVAAFEELIHKQGVSVILGPASSSSARAAFPIAQENGVVAISATAGASGLGAIGDFVFRIALATDIVIPKGVEITQRKLGYQRVATLYDKTDLFSTDRDATIQLALADNGVEVLGMHTYKTGDTDFTQQLTQIKALNPDALFVSALPPEKPLILMQARAAGISVPILISSLTDVEVEAAGTAAEGALTFTGWLPTAETPGNRAFVQQYQKTYGTEPNAFAAVSYACVHVFAAAVKNAESTDAQSIRDALARIQDLDTILGKFSFNENGDGVYEPNILIVRDGVLRFFD
ncbi:hypothetical protein C6501_15450 [Candidatus Poribacteria bacterium]|nr:MAG: hypothetical protein C6501_15450 [Candidatus Poribacteria bacterium]